MEVLFERNLEGIDEMIKFLLGLVLGFVLAIGYYDGVVAKDYKDKLTRASEALIRADQELIKKDEEIKNMSDYIHNLHRQYNLAEVFASKE